MSDHVTLTLRASLDEPVGLESVVPDQLAALDEAEIERLPVWAGRYQRVLGDFFDVRGGRSASVRVVGDVRLGLGLGTGMAAPGASVVVDGNAGSHTGAGMIAGTIEIVGNAGSDTGVGMSGGSIHVRGNAGDRVGAGLPGASRGMTGGEIVVHGTIGDDAGAHMRRGLLFVGGDAGQMTARSIIAGTVVVAGRVGAEPALGSKRGTLVVGREVDVPATYRYACRYHPPHVRLALTHVSRRYHIAIDHRLVQGTFDRYCGDAGSVSRGEILRWVQAS